MNRFVFPLLALAMTAAIAMNHRSAAAQSDSQQTPITQSMAEPNKQQTDQPAAEPDNQQTAESFMLQGEWAQAVGRFREVLAQGTAGSGVHYNLGLAYAHLDRLGLASYHLNQAHLFSPGDSEISEALALVKAELKRRQSEPAVGDTLTKGEPAELFWLVFFHRIGRTSTELILIGSCWLAFGLLLMRRRMKPSGRRDAVLVAIVLAFLVVASSSAYRLGAEITRDEVHPGVIVTEEVTVRQGPDGEAPRRLVRDLFSGSVVLIRGEREDWVEIELADGDTGWLQRDAVRPIVVRE